MDNPTAINPRCDWQWQAESRRGHLGRAQSSYPAHGSWSNTRTSADAETETSPAGPQARDPARQTTTHGRTS